ncbi:MAG: DHA2 family efflux MFS transporter permease subunit [Nitrospira sp.]|nr:DHA2 family efflux MFS transporter permease subunit [Nitrospira sp.]
MQTPHKWIIVLIAILGTFLQALDISIVNVALPNMMGNLGATLDEINWVVTGYIIANVIILPLTGWFTARLGRKRFLVASIITFTLASFLCGIAWNLGTLVFFRILQGMGGGALVPTSQSIIMDSFPPKEQGGAMAALGVGVMVGPTLGPTLGGWITDNYNWPWIFFINVPIGGIAILLALLFLQDSKYSREAPPTVDYLGIFLLGVGVGCLQVILELGERKDWFESNGIITLSFIAASALILFFWWELKMDDPVVNLRILTNRSLSAGTVISTFLGFGLMGTTFMIPVFLQTLLNYTAWQTGKVIILSSISTAIGMFIAGRLIARVSPPYVIAVGATLFTLALHQMSHFTLEIGISDLTLPQILRGAGIGFMFVPLSVAALSTLNKEDIASGSGLYTFMRQIGGSFGIAILVSFLNQREVFHRSILNEHLHRLNPLTTQRLEILERGLLARGLDPESADTVALTLLDHTVTRQARLLSFSDAFLLTAFLMVITLPLLLLLRRKKSSVHVVLGK